MREPGGRLLPETHLDRLIAEGDGGLCLAYLHRLRGGEADAHALAAALRVSEKKAGYLLARLAELSLVCAPPPEALSEPPARLSPAALADRLEEDTGFRSLLETCEARFGRTLSTAETAQLLQQYEWLGLPAEVFCMVIIHLTAENRRKFGPGARTTLRQVGQEAQLWHALGMTSVPLAEGYLGQLQKSRSAKERLKKRLGLTGRALSASEERYLTTWLDMRFSEEVIYQAYDITVLNTGRFKWAYANSILKRWHAKGLLTAEAVAQEAGGAKGAEGAAVPAGGASKRARERAEAYRKLVMEGENRHDG